MKKRYLFALVLAGLTLASCSGTGSIGLNYDESDLDIDTPWVDYSVPVTKVTFDEGESNLVLSRGEVHSYSYSIEPGKASKMSLTWTSSNEEVATVSKGGFVTAVGAGETTITVSNEEGSFTPQDVFVTVIVPVEDICIEQTSVEADFNQQYQLSVAYEPTDTTQKGVTWSSGNESIATVDENGLITTKNIAGDVEIFATSAYINKIAKVTINVADRTIYPVSVEIDSYQETVEIGHSFNFVAHAVAAGDKQVTHPEITYKSTNSDVLSVVEETGAVHALSEGTAEIYAVASNGVESAHVSVSVFEVKVASIILDKVTLSNRNGMSDIAVPYSYTTDNPAYEKASIPQFKFTTGDPNIATVNDNGKIYAVSVGATTLTVSEERSGVSKTVELVVKYEVDEVIISGKTVVTIGYPSKLTVGTNPTGVPSDYVSFSSSNEEIATVSSEGVVNGLKEGSVTITATVLGQSASITLEVEAPDVPFQIGSYYVVGNKNYASGTSRSSSTGSWDRANQAYRFTDKTQDAHDTLLYEYRAVITFAQGDVWKIRDASNYFEPDGWRDGITHQLGVYKTSEGAFAGATPDMHVDENRNIVVDRPGRYAIYYAQYTNDYPEGWYSVYVGRHELTLSNTNLKLQVGRDAILEANNWEGELEYNITDGSDLINVAREDNKFTVTAGGAAGTAKIVFSDDVNSVVVNVTISEAAVAYTATVTIDTSVFTSWSPAGSEISLYVWDDEGTQPLGDWNSCRGNLDSGSVTITHDKDITHFILFLTQDGKTKQTIDLVCLINETATYTVDVSNVHWKDDNGTWKMYDVEIVKSGDTPAPTYTYAYYVEGIGGSWSIKEQYKLNATDDSNLYKLENVHLGLYDEIKVLIYTEDPSVTNPWLGVTSSYSNDYAEGTSTGNLKITTEGDYDIDVYLVSEYGNHIIITPHSGSQGEFDNTKVTVINVQNETTCEFTKYEVDIKLHIFDVEFADYSPITTIAGLEEAQVEIGTSTTYDADSGYIDVVMEWKQSDPTIYSVTLPAYIESCKICVCNTNNVFVHKVVFTEEGSYVEDFTYAFSTERDNAYTLYLFNNLNPNYNAWIDGDKMNTPLDLVKEN